MPLTFVIYDASPHQKENGEWL